MSVPFDWCPMSVKVSHFTYQSTLLSFKSLSISATNAVSVSHLCRAVIMLYIDQDGDDWANRNMSTLTSLQNGRHFTDNIFICIFLNENVPILITISLNIVPYGLLDRYVSICSDMAWRLTGDKPLSERMMVHSATNMCATRTHWVEQFFWVKTSGWWRKT